MNFSGHFAGFAGICRNFFYSPTSVIIVNYKICFVIFEKDMPREMTFQWADRHGSLDTGHYRAVKWFFEFHENETEHDKRVVDFALAAEFDIK